MNNHSSHSSTVLPRFYLIVDNAQWLEELLPTGLKLVQLRIKDKPESYVKSQIRLAQSLCEEAGCQLIVNDYWHLAAEAGCNYVHLGQGDLDTADTLQLKAAGIKIGISTHDRAELDRAMALEPDYIALGPVYETILKKMEWRPQGLSKLTRWKSRISTKPLVAIGGLTPQRGVLALQAGADSVCVVTDVLLHENPADRVREWLSVTG